MTAPDRAVSPLGDSDGAPGLAALFEVTGVAAISADTPPAEVGARLEALRRRIALAEKLAVSYLREAGWRDAERVVRRALAGASAPHGAPAETPKPAPLALRYPALDFWRRRVRAGQDGQRFDAAGRWEYDAVWRAACWESAALQAERDGQPDVWAARMQAAREVMAEDVARRGRVA